MAKIEITYEDDGLSSYIQGQTEQELYEALAIFSQIDAETDVEQEAIDNTIALVHLLLESKKR